MYDEKSKKRTMKYLSTLKEIRFRIKPEEYTEMEREAKKHGYKNMRPFYLDAIREKIERWNPEITREPMEEIP